MTWLFVILGLGWLVLTLCDLMVLWAPWRENRR